MPATIADRLLCFFSWICALTLTAGVSLIIGFLILKGWKALTLELIFANTTPLNAILLRQQVFDGLFPAMAGTFFLVLPYIIKTTQNAIESIPLLTRLTVPSMGASRLQNIVLVLLPAAISDIVSGVVLAIGRCAEDTAVIMLTGVVATACVPKSPFSSFEALPFYIYYMASEYSGPSELVKGYGAALILLMIITSLFVLAHVIRVRIDQKTKFG